MARLVSAHNACYAPHVPDEPPLTLAAFKRDVRDLHVWCSSSMIAMEGNDPVGVLIGAKRPEETLVRRIGVRPDRLRRGHGRHLLASLGAKLAILGPQRIVAEIPAARPAAAAFFEACGYAREATLTDFILDAVPRAPEAAGSFVIPAGVADLDANGLLRDTEGVAWERAAATLRGREDLLEGIALASADTIEAFLLYRHPAAGRAAGIAALRAPDAASLRRLVALVADRTGAPLTIAKVHPDEFPGSWLHEAGFRAAGVHHRYAARALPG
jgi:N-acetylglutamate synthase-like GNAT family acetyltransferase